MAEVHPQNDEFPLSNGEKYCVFCQQPLSNEAEQRLKRFNLFICNDTNNKLNKAKEMLEIEKLKIKQLTLCEKNCLDELENDNLDLFNKLTEFTSNFEKYKKHLLEYIDNCTVCDKKLCDFMSPDSSVEEFNKYIVEIDTKISKNTQSKNEKGELQLEYRNLCNKEELFINIESVVKYYESQKKIQRINSYRSFLPKNSITREISQLLENESIVVFNENFDKYIEKISPTIAEKIEIKKEKASAGKVYQKNYLKNHNGEKITEVLSEGEQKVVMLANFLAECSIENNGCAIVFDDLVTSLDYKYRDTIASVLVELSRERQIIVLTHDFYFTRLLIDTYEKVFKNKDEKLVSLNVNGNYVGIPSDELPYLLKNVSERIKNIQSDLKNIISSIDITDVKNKNFILDSLRKKMRELLEKTIEEIFTGKSIERFSKNIHCRAKSLSSFVCVDKFDIDLILSLFSRYSETEHDGTPNPNLATEDDIQLDLERYNDWLEGFKAKVK